MKKTVLIVGAVAVILITVVTIAVALYPNEQAAQPAPEPGTPFPVASSTNGQNGGGTAENERMAVKTADGNTVVTRNFIKNTNTVEDPANRGNYYLGNHLPFDGTTPAKSPSYVIEYIAATQYFNVILYAEPLSRARIEAEQYLLGALGITREQMCFLDYTVSVPNFVNEYYTGRNLGFSFCPGSIPLE